MLNNAGKGYVDYVLWGDDGKPLGLVEAKRTSSNPTKGKQQAKLYADCLEQKFNQRPVIFYSNGYNHWIWDDVIAVDKTHRTLNSLKARVKPVIESMPKPYSYDLRQKVINAIELDGMKKSEAAQVFELSRNTIDLWLKRHSETGDYQAKANRPHRSANKITDWHKFTEFAQKHGDKTQAEMAELWEGEISARTISRALKKIGFTRKSGCVRAVVARRLARAPSKDLRLPGTG